MKGAVRPPGEQAAVLQAPQAIDRAGYLELLAARLAAEGFTVVHRARAGQVGLALLATRKGGQLRDTDSVTVLVADEEALGPRGLEPVSAESFIPFCLAAFDSQASAGEAVADATGLLTRLRARHFVVPVVIGRAGVAPRLVETVAALQLRRGAQVGLPAVVDVGQAAVHLLRRPVELGRDGARVLAYLWWLLSPRVLERPREHVRWAAIHRIAALVAMGIMILAAVTYALVTRERPIRRWRVWVSDPASGRLASAFHATGGDPSELVIEDPAAHARTVRTVRHDAFLCDLAGDELTYRVCDDARCELDRYDLGSGRSERLASLPAASGCPRRSPDGRRYAHDAPGPRQRRTAVFDAGGAPAAPAGLADGDEMPAWFPDGQRLVVSAHGAGRPHLELVDLAGGARTDVTGGDAAHDDVKPAVAPDGATIAFYRIVRHAYDDAAWRDTSAAGDLVLVGLAGGAASAPRTLAPDVCLVSPPAWLDPSHLVFSRWTGEHCELFVYDLGARTSRKL